MITSRYTSFIAIDDQEDNPSSESWVIKIRNIPSELAHGWHGDYTNVLSMIGAKTYGFTDESITRSTKRNIRVNDLMKVQVSRSSKGGCNDVLSTIRAKAYGCTEEFSMTRSTKCNIRVDSLMNQNGVNTSRRLLSLVSS